MKRILLTGVSGSGQSTTVTALAERGYKAIDTDTADWCEWVEVAVGADERGSTVEPDRDWIWREDLIVALLAAEDADLLFLSGCPSNMPRFIPEFDAIILLSAPAAVTVERLARRTNNLYGKQPHELERILSLKSTVEPLLRRIAALEVDTDAPIDEVVDKILSFVSAPGEDEVQPLPARLAAPASRGHRNRVARSS